ncbi:MAG: DUF2779 domain-containing protein [bacterium]
MGPLPDILISKGRYLSGLKCAKLLWCQYNDKDIFPPIDAATQAKFDQGHIVGELATRLFSNGIMVKTGSHYAEALVPATLEAVKEGRPLYEPGFVYKNAYALMDILNPVEGGAWDLFEVKSATSVKDVYIPDVAIQKYILEGAGLELRRCYLMHINNQYVLQGDLDPAELFVSVDITERVDDFIDQVDGELDGMLEVIRSRKCPDVPIGVHCYEPYDCDLIPVCFGFLPDHDVTTLSGRVKTRFELLDRGIQDISDIPDGFPLNSKQQIQVDAVKSGEIHFEAGAARRFLDSLEYPLHFLDFETLWPAIPVYDGTRPYQQVPFQFSLHIMESPGSEPVHYSYLPEGTEDPRPEILKRLSHHIGPTGSIVAYNAGFEVKCLRQSAEAYPQYSDWFDVVEPRIVDLLDPFKNFNIYHPDQDGTASLKAVLPAFTGIDWGDEGVVNGETAGTWFYKITFEETTDEEKQEIRRQLEEYCRKDTEGLIHLLNKLREMVRDA